MKIHNIRLGFATNSSSTHSIVMNPNMESDWSVPDKDNGWGWSDFLLRSKKNKAQYAAALIVQNMQHGGLPSDYAVHTVNGLLGNVFEERDPDFYAGIDHQSVIILPFIHQGPMTKYNKDYKGVCQINLDFAKEFFNYIVENDNIAIAGGNDNNEDIDYGGEKLLTEMQRDGGSTNNIARKDGSYWTIFNRKNGTKIRLSFNDNAPPYERSTTPELIDIKLTNFCPYNCDFCYQNSTIQGKHAELRTLERIFDSLGELEVFEVALGGGETTKHPEFHKVLRAAHIAGLTPNFTSFNMEWSKNKEIEKAVLDYCGGFAISLTEDRVKNRNKIKSVSKWLNKNTSFIGRVQFQLILGLMDEKNLLETIEEIKKQSEKVYCDFGITLLGYKTFGRAINLLQNIHKINLKNVVECAKENYIKLGLDTKAVQNHKDDLADAEICSLLTTDKEGVFSMYIDAVEKTVSKDSYSDQTFPFNFEVRTEFEPEYEQVADENHLDNVIARNFPFN